jgi:hypothetical protein
MRAFIARGLVKITMLTEATPPPPRAAIDAGPAHAPLEHIIRVQTSTGRRMRVLLVIAENTMGGVCQGILTLLQALDTSQFAVTIATPPGPYSERFRDTGARLIDIPIKHALDITALPCRR